MSVKTYRLFLFVVELDGFLGVTLGLISHPINRN